MSVSGTQQRKRNVRSSSAEEDPARQALGHIAAIDEQGRVFVTTLRGLQQPRAARLCSTLQRDELLYAAATRQTVLLLYENDVPIIVGLIRDHLPAPASSPQAPHDRLLLEAQEEVVLRCGPGSITLRKDGKVVIKGVDLVSRARQTNRIRGAAVKIN
jgi:hypothetical protein